MQLQAMHYRLSRIGEIFCTHFPHEASKARQEYDKNKAAKTGWRLEIEKLVKNYLRWLKSDLRQRPSSRAHLQRSRCQTQLSQTNCIGAKPNDPTHGTSVTRFLEDSKAREECHDIHPNEVTYLLVTQCSDDRLWMIEHHCKR